jgi:hypothetical protein
MCAVNELNIFMFTEMFKIGYLDEIQYQVSMLDWSQGNRIVLNESDGGLFSGKYTTLSQFQNTALGLLLEELGDIGEARLLRLECKDAYTVHTDPDDRIHLAIETNPHAYIMDIENNSMIHIPADGTVWHMDTSKKHMAGNFGGTPRIHLNVRVKLPNYTKGGYHLTISGGSYDWKQELYMDTMSFLNRNIKNRNITGLEKLNERELLINCEHETLVEIIELVESKNFECSVQADS